ncbi:MAG: hypothetical protein HKO57_11870 [Akkermansiaceae bacterium]|nr:hypothetical protein [Akkermansiaceae bacterium]
MLDHASKISAFLVLIGGLGLPAHAEQEGPAAGSAQLIAVDTAPAPAAAAARTKALGFARFLPKDTEGYLGIFDGAGFVNDLRKSKLGKFLESRAREEGMDLTDIENEPSAAMALAMLAEEVTVAVGKATPEQANNLVLLSESSNYHQMKFLVKMFDAEIRDEELEDPGMMLGMQEAMLLGGLLHDPKGGINILENSYMPPITIAFKMSDADLRDEMSGMIKGGLQELLLGIGPEGENIAAAVDFERGDTKFSGVRLVGKKVAAKIGEDEKEDLAQFLDAASIERLIAAISAKDLVLATGIHDSYLVIFLGSNPADLKIAATPGESLAARDDLSFADAYLGKKLLAVSTLSKELQEGLAKNTTALGSVARGIKDGLAEAESFGDTRDLEVLLGLVETQEKALLGSVNYTPAGVVVFREAGLKMETFGGAGSPDLDLGKAHRYGKLADWDGGFLFANWVEDPAYTEAALEYLDTLGETVYLAASRISKLDLADPDFEQFKEGFTLFDKRIRPHALGMWRAFRKDLQAGLGSEGAVVVDLRGGLPTVPGLPQVVADKGKAPRLGVIAPIKDAARISASWKGMNESLEGLLKVFSEISGTNVPMQRPMSSEKDDLQTWFFSIQFQNDDFVLSVSQDKENFYLSTSRNFVKELSGALAQARPDPSRKGAYFAMDFTSLTAFAKDWLALVEANAADIFGGDDGAAGFRENIPMIKETIAAFGDLDSLRAHTRLEDGTTRTSLHFKVN